MGLLDLPAPLFAWLDGLLGTLIPPLGRLALWALAAAALSMALYRATSAQERIGQLQGAAARARGVLIRYDGALDGLRPLLADCLSLSLRQVWLTGWPAVLASLPVLVLLAWLSTAYGRLEPRPAALVQVRVYPESAAVTWDGPVRRAPETDAWLVAWPGLGEAARLSGPDGRPIVELPLAAPVAVVHKKQWWNALLGNPAGYIPEGAALERVEIGLAKRRYLGFGPGWPGWIGSWEAIFLAVLVISSLAIKLVFRIK